MDAIQLAQRGSALSQIGASLSIDGPERLLLGNGFSQPVASETSSAVIVTISQVARDGQMSSGAILVANPSANGASSNTLLQFAESHVVMPSLPGPVGDRALSSQLELANPVNISTGTYLLDNFNLNKVGTVNLASTAYQDIAIFKGKHLDRYL